MTLKEVSDTYKINIDILYKELGFDKDKISETTALKEIKNIIDGFEVQTLRDIVDKLIK